LIYSGSSEEHAPPEGVPKAKGKQVVCQTWEMRIRGDGSGFPWT
jgi:hypothetical protein